MGRRVALAEVVGVAGRHERHAELLGDRDGPFRALLLDVEAVVLNFDEEVIPSEHVRVPAGEPGRLVHLVFQDQRAELARRAAAQADDPLVVLLQQLLVDPRAIVEAFEEGERGELDEVPEAGLVLGEEGEVVARFADPLGVAVGAVAGGDVGLVADDRLDTHGGRLAVQLDGSVKVAVVGQSDRVHTELLDVPDQLGDAAGAVQEAVVTVAVEVDKGPVHGALTLVRSRHSQRWDGSGCAGVNPLSYRPGPRPRRDGSAQEGALGARPSGPARLTRTAAEIGSGCFGAAVSFVTAPQRSDGSARGGPA